MAKVDEFFNRVSAVESRAKDMTNVLSDSGDFIDLHGINAILNSLVNMLLIEPSSYLFDPEFGIGVQTYLFEPNDSKTRNKLKRTIKENFKKYDGRAEIDVKIKPSKSRKSFKVVVILSYLDSEKEVSLNVNHDLLSRLQRNI